MKTMKKDKKGEAMNPCDGGKSCRLFVEKMDDGRT
jgi:hypothetical protein